MDEMNRMLRARFSDEEVKRAVKLFGTLPPGFELEDASKDELPVINDEFLLKHQTVALKHPEIETVSNIESNYIPLTAEFKDDFKQPGRLDFIFNMPHFEKEEALQSEQFNKLSSDIFWLNGKAFLSAQEKKYSASSIDTFLHAGINVHYLTYRILMEEFKNEFKLNKEQLYSVDFLQQSFYGRLIEIFNANKLTLKNRKMIERFMDIYSHDFKGFHEMMMKTFLLPRVFEQEGKEASPTFHLSMRLVSMYKGHPKELAEFFESQSNHYGFFPGKDDFSMINCLHDSHMFRATLNALSAKDLFLTPETQSVLKGLFFISIANPALTSTTIRCLDKLVTLQGEERLQALDNLFKENGDFLIEQFASPKRIERFEKEAPRKQFAFFEELINHSLAHGWAPALQDFFVACPRPLIVRFLSAADMSSVKNFYQVMRSKKNPAADILIRNTVVWGETRAYSLLEHLNKHDALPEQDVEPLLGRPKHLYESTTEFNHHLFNLLKSFNSVEKGSAFILKHFDFVWREMQFYASHLQEVFLENRFAHTCVKEGKADKLLFLKTHRPLNNPLNFASLLKAQDCHGDTVLHLACRNSDRDLFNALSPEDYEALKGAFNISNFSALLPLDMASRGFRKWMSEHIPALKEVVETYNEAIYDNKEGVFFHKEPSVVSDLQKAELSTEIVQPLSTVPKKQVYHPVLKTERFEKMMEKLKTELTPKPETEWEGLKYKPFEQLVENVITALSCTPTQKLLERKGKKGYGFGVRCARVKYDRNQYRVIYIFEKNTLVFLACEQRTEQLYQKHDFFATLLAEGQEALKKNPIEPMTPTFKMHHSSENKILQNIGSDTRLLKKA